MSLRSFSPVVESLSAKRAGGLFSGLRQAADFSFRFSQAGARNLEPAGELLQVHAHHWHGVAARGAIHVGTPLLIPAFVRRAPPSRRNSTECCKGQRLRYWAWNSRGVSSGGI